MIHPSLPTENTTIFPALFLVTWVIIWRLAIPFESQNDSSKVIKQIPNCGDLSKIINFAGVGHRISGKHSFAYAPTTISSDRREQRVLALRIDEQNRQREPDFNYLLKWFILKK
jgi:hypothetical protein